MYTWSCKHIKRTIIQLVFNVYVLRCYHMARLSSRDLHLSTSYIVHLKFTVDFHDSNELHAPDLVDVDHQVYCPLLPFKVHYLKLFVRLPRFKWAQVQTYCLQSLSRDSIANFQRTSLLGVTVVLLKQPVISSWFRTRDLHWPTVGGSVKHWERSYGDTVGHWVLIPGDSSSWLRVGA